MKKGGTDPCSSFLLYSAHHCTTVECWEKGTAAEKGIHSGKALQEGGRGFNYVPVAPSKRGKWMGNENSPSVEEFSQLCFSECYSVFLVKEENAMRKKQKQESFFFSACATSDFPLPKTPPPPSEKKKIFSLSPFSPSLASSAEAMHTNAERIESGIEEERRRKKKENPIFFFLLRIIVGCSRSCVR